MADSNMRIEWVDAAKGIGILMVMFGHNWLDWKYCYYFYSFHMPLFFILAGYTFSDRRAPFDFIKQKAKVLIIPYVLFVCCYLIFYGVLSHTHGGDYDMGGKILAFLMQQRHTYLWFLPVLFLSELCVYVLSRAKLVTNIKLGVILFVLALLHYLTIYTKCVNLIWNIDLVPMASVYIILGILYKRVSVKWTFENNKWIAGLLFCFSLLVSTINFVVWDRVDIWGNSYGCLPLFYLGAISATYATVLLLKQISIPRMLIFLGVNSLLLYGLHRMAIEIFFIVWNKLGIPYDGISCLSLCMAVCNVLLTCVLLYPVVSFINRRCPWILGKF
jgi:acyltransferase